MNVGRAVVFDLGDTLVEYEGIPLSWGEHYPEAIKCLAAHLELAPSDSQFDSASKALSRYNTRNYPRERECDFSEILYAIREGLGDDSGDEVCAIGAARAFFKIFRQRLCCFPEVSGSLGRLKKSGVLIGVFTDVPYGMPRELVIEDIESSGLLEFIDIVVTSGDCGWRKPSRRALESVCIELGCSSSDVMYVGNEAKDVEAASRFGCGSVLIDRLGSGVDYGQDFTIAAISEFL